MTVSSAVDPSAVARVLGIETIFKNLRAGNVVFLPQRIAVIAQGNTLSTYATTKRQVTSANEAATIYGFGSPIHLATKQLLPINGDGVGSIPVTIYPLVDDASGVVATGDITPAGSQTVAAAYQVSVNNILSNSFVISVGDTVADIVTAITVAINATLDLPIIAVDGTTKVDITSKWEGVSANQLVLSIVGSTTAGTTFGITQPVGGLVDPDVQSALDQVGDVWETLFLNAVGDSASLTAINTFGEGRWGALTRKPMMSFIGNTDASVATAITVPETRKTERTNVQLVEPGSDDLLFVVAARQMARIAVVANTNPPRDYGSQKATGLTPGTDGEQWNYLQRDTAVKGGSSTIEVKDGVVNLSDTITFYHPDGDSLPAYRYVNDVVKLQNILFNLNLIFATEDWDGAPLIPDSQTTSNPAAKQPKAAKAEIASLIDSLADEAIISDPETAKQTIIAEINGANPKRLDVTFTVQLSGNTNIISVDFNFGFFFG